MTDIFARYQKAIAGAAAVIVAIGSTLLTQDLLTGSAKHWATVIVAVCSVLATYGAVAFAPYKPKVPVPTALGLSRRIADIEQLLAAKRDQEQNVVRTWAYAPGSATTTATAGALWHLNAADAGAAAALAKVSEAAANLELPTVYVEDLPRLDPRLGRSVRHDDRSRAWAVPELPKSEIKPVRWTRRAPVLDQGQIGSCTGNAAAGWLATDNTTRAGNPGINEKYAIGLYSDATKIDPFKGTYPPTDTGSNGLAVAKVLQNRGLCANYSHAFTPQAAYSALQNGPVMVGSVWLQSMFTPNRDGRIVVDRHSKVAGGHEYLIDELETDGHGNVTKVWICNSWGQRWGIQGRAWYARADFEWIIGQKGDVTCPQAVPVKENNVPIVIADAFTTAVARFPGLAEALAKNAKTHQVNGRPMTPEELAAWKLAGDFKKR